MRADFIFDPATTLLERDDPRWPEAEHIFIKGARSGEIGDGVIGNGDFRKGHGRGMTKGLNNNARILPEPTDSVMSGAFSHPGFSVPVMRQRRPGLRHD